MLQLMCCLEFRLEVFQIQNALPVPMLRQVYEMTSVVPLWSLLGCFGLPPALPRHSLGFSWTSLGPPGTSWEAFGGPQVVF